MGGGVVCHVGLVGLAFYVVFLGEVASFGNCGVFVAVVPDCDVGAAFCEGFGNGVANSCAGAGDDGGFLGEVEELVDLGVRGW